MAELYNEKMKGLFGMRSTRAEQLSRQATKSTMEFEENTIDANKDLLKLGEKQIELLRDIKKGLGNIDGGGLDIKDLIGLKLGSDALDGLLKRGGRGRWFGRIGTAVSGMRDKLFNTTVGSSRTFVNSLSTSIKSVFTNTSGFVSKSTSRLSASVATYVSSMTGSILKSIRGLTTLISGLFKTSLAGVGAGASIGAGLKGVGGTVKNLAKRGLNVLGKYALPLTTLVGGYSGVSQANKLDTGNQLNFFHKMDAAQSGILDTMLFGLPEMISGKSFAQRTTEHNLAVKKMREETGQKSVWDHAKGLFDWFSSDEPKSSVPRDKRGRPINKSSLKDATNDFDAGVNSSKYREHVTRDARGRKIKARGEEQVFGTYNSNYAYNDVGGIGPAASVRSIMDNISSNSDGISLRPGQHSPINNHLKRLEHAMETNTKVIAFTTSKTTRAVEKGNEDARKRDHRGRLTDKAKETTDEASTENVRDPSIWNSPTDFTNADGARYPANTSQPAFDSNGKPIISGTQQATANTLGGNPGLFGKSAYPGGMPEPVGPSGAFTATDLGNYRRLATLAKAANSNGQFVDPMTNPNVNDAIKSRYEGKHVPVAIRNNNPAAVSITGRESDISNSFAARQPGFVGVSKRPANEGGWYAKYATPEHGVAAASTLLKNYGKRGINTTDKIVRKWSTDSSAWNSYSKTLQKYLDQAGIDSSGPLNLDDANTRAAILKAKSAHESGAGVPTYKDGVYTRGVNNDFGGIDTANTGNLLQQNLASRSLGTPGNKFAAPNNIFKNRVAMNNQGAIRDKPLSPELTDVLNYAAAMSGIDSVEVNSGGQVSSRNPYMHKKPGGWTGSHRHDNGGAGDMSLRVGGRLLSLSNPADRPIIENFVRNSAKAGATGIGAGKEYMGSNKLHVGFGKEATWGSEKEWLKNAMDQGKSQREGFNLAEWKKSQSALVSRVVKAETFKIRNEDKELAGAQKDMTRFLNNRNIDSRTGAKVDVSKMSRLGSYESYMKEAGKAIGRGVVDAQQERITPPSISAVQTAPTAFEPTRPPRNSTVAENPAGSSRQSDKEVVQPSQVPHTDELTMMMANSQMMA